MEILVRDEAQMCFWRLYLKLSFFPGMAVTYRPDGQELAVATLDGEISFWNTQTSAQTGSITGRHDLQMGRKDTDKITAKQSAKGKWVHLVELP